MILLPPWLRDMTRLWAKMVPTCPGGKDSAWSIARAIVRNAPILVLDEATSALDNQSESLVHKQHWTN